MVFQTLTRNRKKTEMASIQAGELPRAEDAQSTASSLFGDYAAHFSRELRERAQKMTYAYCLFYCFENSVSELVAQRLEERKGASWWSFAVPANVQKRVETKKEEIENNKWHQAFALSDRLKPVSWRREKAAPAKPPRAFFSADGRYQSVTPCAIDGLG